MFEVHRTIVARGGYPVIHELYYCVVSDWLPLDAQEKFLNR